MGSALALTLLLASPDTTWMPGGMQSPGVQDSLALVAPATLLSPALNPSAGQGHLRDHSYRKVLGGILAVGGAGLFIYGMDKARDQNTSEVNTEMLIGGAAAFLGVMLFGSS